MTQSELILRYIHKVLDEFDITECSGVGCDECAFKVGSVCISTLIRDVIETTGVDIK